VLKFETAKSIAKALHRSKAATVTPANVMAELSAQRTKTLSINTHQDHGIARMIGQDICGDVAKTRSPNVDKADFDRTLSMESCLIYGSIISTARFFNQLQLLS
jgi:hypothetical protein